MAHSIYTNQVGTTAYRINRIGKMLIGQQLAITFAEIQQLGRVTEPKPREKIIIIIQPSDEQREDEGNKTF